MVWKLSQKSLYKIKPQIKARAIKAFTSLSMRRKSHEQMFISKMLINRCGCQASWIRAHDKANLTLSHLRPDRWVSSDCDFSLWCFVSPCELTKAKQGHLEILKTFWCKIDLSFMGIHIIFMDKPQAKSWSKVQAHVKSKRGKEGICLCTLSKISWWRKSQWRKFKAVWS